MTTSRELLTPAECAARLRMSRDTFDRGLKNGTLAKHGLVEANRVTRRRYFDASSVDRVLWKRQVGR